MKHKTYLFHLEQHFWNHVVSVHCSAFLKSCRQDLPKCSLEHEPRPPDLQGPKIWVLNWWILMNTFLTDLSLILCYNGLWILLCRRRLMQSNNMYSHLGIWSKNWLLIQMISNKLFKSGNLVVFLLSDFSFFLLFLPKLWSLNLICSV